MENEEQLIRIIATLLPMIPEHYKLQHEAFFRHAEWVSLNHPQLEVAEMNMLEVFDGN